MPDHRIGVAASDEDADEDEDRLLSGNKNFWVAYKEVKNDTTSWSKYDFKECMIFVQSLLNDIFHKLYDYQNLIK